MRPFTLNSSVSLIGPEKTPIPLSHKAFDYLSREFPWEPASIHVYRNMSIHRQVTRARAKAGACRARASQKASALDRVGGSSVALRSVWRFRTTTGQRSKALWPSSRRSRPTRTPWTVSAVVTVNEAHAVQACARRPRSADSCPSTASSESWTQMRSTHF